MAPVKNQPKNPPKEKVGAVSRGYNVAHAWEKSAALSDLEAQVVSLVSQSASERPLPRHLLEVDESPDPTQSPLKRTSSKQACSAPSTNDEDLVLQNTHQFYKWHSELESAMSSETEQKYRQYVEDLQGHLSTCDQILSEVDLALSGFENLQDQYKSVDVKTRALHDSCQRLVHEKERLLEFSSALTSKLDYFDELDRIAAAFHSGLAVDGSHFLPLLKRLDECINYVNSNPHYADAASFAMKFKQLHSRALGSVRSHVLNVLRRAASKVQGAMQEQMGAQSSGAVGQQARLLNVAEGAETSVLYVRFRAAAPELRALMEEMESRAMRREYHQLLSDCHVLYCEQRLGLLAPVVQDRLLEYSQAQPLTTLTRSGCSYLMQVCQLEHQLFEHFFPTAAGSEVALAPLLDPLCTVLYDILRPACVQLAEVDSLCELVEIVKGEVLEEQLGRRRDASGAGIFPTARRILADIQERLIFRAQTYIRDEVMGYQPSDADLDYPGKLERAAAEAANQEADAEGVPEDMQFSTWYPPVERTLTCLSKLYRCVDPAIFSSLAQEAVAVCSESVHIGRRMVQRRVGSTPQPPSGDGAGGGGPAVRTPGVDAMLFLIKHLLVLREQIAPFNTEFQVVNKELDFTHMRDHLRRLMKGESSLLTFSASNAFLSLVTSGGPRVLENQVDSKKDLEKQLKVVCEEFIMAVTKLSVEPMLSFITKVTAVKVSSANSAADSKSLRDQAFAAPQKLAQVVDSVNEALSTALPSVAQKMKLYLVNPSTRAILFKPIKSNIAEAHGQIAQLLETEYTPDDVLGIKLLGAADLNAKLDLFC